MDLEWKAARRRHWVELAARENLTNRDVAERAGVDERTVRRWCRNFRDQAVDRYFEIASIPAPDQGAVDLRPFDAATPAVTVNPPLGEEGGQGATEPAAAASETPAARAAPMGFSEIVPASPPEGPQIQIAVQGGGRVLLSGPLDTELLSRLIAVLKPC